MTISEEAGTERVGDASNDAVAEADDEERVKHYVIHDSSIRYLALGEPTQLGPHEVQRRENGAVEHYDGEDHEFLAAARASKLLARAKVELDGLSTLINRLK